MNASREQQLAENAWHLNQAAIHLDQLTPGPDLVIDDDAKNELQTALTDLRNKCLTAPFGDDLT